MSDPSLSRLLSRLRSSMETTKRRTWFELQRCHYYAHPPSILTHADLSLALQHFHATATHHELTLLFSHFPDGAGGFSFRAFAQHLYPLDEASPLTLPTPTRFHLHPTLSSPSSHPTPTTPCRPPTGLIPATPSPSSLRSKPSTRHSPLPPPRASTQRHPRPAKYFHRPSPLGRMFDVSERPQSQETLRATYTQQLSTGQWVRV